MLNYLIFRLDFWYYSDIETQIKNIYNANKNNLIRNLDNRNDEIISDCYDGSIYKDFRKSTNYSLNNFSLLINTDGILLSEKSSRSVWPIYLVINELPLNIRFCLENVIIAGNYIYFSLS